MYLSDSKILVGEDKKTWSIYFTIYSSDTDSGH
jgi:hypothetical protein